MSRVGGIGTNRVLNNKWGWSDKLMEKARQGNYTPSRFSSREWASGWLSLLLVGKDIDRFALMNCK